MDCLSRTPLLEVGLGSPQLRNFEWSRPYYFLWQLQRFDIPEVYSICSQRNLNSIEQSTCPSRNLPSSLVTPNKEEYISCLWLGTEYRHQYFSFKRVPDSFYIRPSGFRCFWIHRAKKFLWYRRPPIKTVLSLMMISSSILFISVCSFSTSSPMMSGIIKP